MITRRSLILGAACLPLVARASILPDRWWKDDDDLLRALLDAGQEVVGHTFFLNTPCFHFPYLVPVTLIGCDFVFLKPPEISKWGIIYPRFYAEYGPCEIHYNGFYGAREYAQGLYQGRSSYERYLVEIEDRHLPIRPRTTHGTVRPASIATAKPTYANWWIQDLNNVTESIWLENKDFFP